MARHPSPPVHVSRVEGVVWSIGSTCFPDPGWARSKGGQKTPCLVYGPTVGVPGVFCYDSDVPARLNDTLEYSDAIDDFNQQISHFKPLARSRFSTSRNVSAASLDFLRDHGVYLRTREVWSTWSAAGVLVAADLLSVPRGKIARTVDCLESRDNPPNGVLAARNGRLTRLPRIDYWIVWLITDLVPRSVERLAEAERVHARHGDVGQGTNARDQDRDDCDTDLATSLLTHFLERTDRGVDSDVEETDGLSRTCTRSGSLGLFRVSADGESAIEDLSVLEPDELDLRNLFLDDPQRALDSEDIVPYLPRCTPLPLPPSSQPPPDFVYDSDTPDEPILQLGVAGRKETRC